MSQERSPSQAEGRDSFQSVLVLRKLTRAVADTLRLQMMDYLAALTPLLRPKIVLGDYIQGGQKEPARKADKAFKELQALYEAVATTKPFSLPRDLKPPIDAAACSATPASCRSSRAPPIQAQVIARRLLEARA